MKTKRLINPVPLVSVWAGILIAALSFGCTNQMLNDATARNSIENPQAGNGKVGEPIPITSAADMALIGKDDDYPLNGDYSLIANITLSNWTPIGTEDKPFSGTFTGTGSPNNFTITVTDFIFDSLQGNHVGIFGYLGTDTTTTPPTTAAISNLNIQAKVLEENPGVKEQYIGLLAGYAATGVSIQNVSIPPKSVLEITASGTSEYVGGLVGYALDTTFQNINTFLP